MALQSSGAISLANIQTEFGGTNPISLSEYYSKGNAPASGEIQLAADFYGTSDTVDLDLTLQGGNVERGNGTFTGVSIGTANTNRMVIIQGGEKGSAIVAPTSITIGGDAMTLLRNTNIFIAYKKVPTGTTADIVISGGGGTFTQQIITLNTVNTAPNQNSITTTSAPANATTTSTMTTNPVSDDGVFIWGLAHTGGGPAYPTSSLLTSNSSGVTTTINQPVTSDYTSTLMAYSECNTTDSRNAQTRVVQSSAKSTATFYSVFTYFQAS